jgi:succinoglycan biosynthesis protein ExoA
MMRSRILHLRASNFVGGPERQIFRYAAYEDDGNVDVIVGSFVGTDEGKAFVEEARSRGLKTLGLTANGAFSLAKELAEVVRKENITLICAHGYKATIVGLLARRRTNVAVVPFLRGTTAENLKVRIYEWLEDACLSDCDRIVCLSHNQRERLSKRKHLRAKLRIVNNVIETGVIDRKTARQELEQRYRLPADALVIATAGRLSPEKGTRYFIEAMPAIIRVFPNAIFVIFGDGARRSQLEALVATQGLSGHVRFAGLVPDFPALLAGVDLLVNPSLREEMPNVVLEAMSACVPVVATAVGGVSELSDGGAACRLISPADSASISEGVISVLRSDPWQLAQAGLVRVQQHYSPSKQKAQLRDLYTDVLPWVKFDSSSILNETCPFISVVLPVRNEEPHIAATLESLLQQEYPAGRYEILVADGNSTDGTRDVVQRIGAQARTSVRCLPNPKQLSSAGRNVGIRAAQGEIITIVDGHCEIPGRYLLAEIARLTAANSAEALSRPQPLFCTGNSWFQDVVARVRETTLGHGRDSTIYSLSNSGWVDPTSSGATYRRELFERVGYFDENFDACEDVEFNHRVKRAGVKAFIDPALAIFYRPRPDLLSLFHQLRRYGTGRFRLIREHPDAMSLSQFVPPALIAWSALALFGVKWPAAGYVVGSGLILYLGIVLLFSLRLGLRFGWKTAFTAPFVYLAIHLGLGFGFWRGVLESARILRPVRPDANRVATMSQKAN